jgi:CrcB protein
MAAILAVALGGSTGALARFGIDSLFERQVESVFPWSTFAINLSGCFLNGLLVAVVVDSLGAPQWVGRGLIIGFLGAYTTFSTLQYETYRLLEDGAVGLAAANVLGSAAAGLFAVYLGVVAGRAW